METSWTELIVKADTPNINGITYSREAITAAFEVYMKREDRFGCIGQVLSDSESFDKISHSVERIYWEGDKLYGTIKILSTPCGKALRDIIGTCSESMTLGLSCRARVDRHVSSIDLFEGEETSFVSELDVVTVPVLEKRLTNH